MKHPLPRMIGIQVPPDGYTPEEQMLEKVLAEESVATLYSKLPTSRMKAIVAMHFELGYKQELIARVFGVSQPQIGLEIAYIKGIFLNKPHRATAKPQGHRPHVNRSKTPRQLLSLADVMRIFAMVTQE